MGLEKLNGDLHQPSRIRYVSRSFSVRCLFLLHIGKGLVSMVTLSVVVPQAIGSFLRNISHLRIFGYLVYIHIPKEKRKNLDPSEKKGIFVGYSESSKAYRIRIQ